MVLVCNFTLAQEKTSEDLSENLYITPSNPATYDIIKLIHHAYFVEGSVSHTTPTVNISGYNILVYFHYIVGGFQYVNDQIDTTAIGTLSSGSYTLIYYESQYMSSMDTTFYGQDTLYFTINGPTGIINNTTADSHDISIYPNPVSDNLQISLTTTKQEKLHIEISDLTGRIILSKECITIPNKNTFSFSTTSISQGTYFVTIYSEQRRLKTEKIVKVE